MAMHHRFYPIFGVQLHPESILTPHGKQLLQNFLDVPSIAIEPATVADAEELLVLQKRAFRIEAERYDDYQIPPMTQTVEQLRADFERQRVIKASLKGKIVGSVRGYRENGTCHVGRLVVDPNYLRRGIGRRLMHALEDAFAETARFELFTGEHTAPALRLYEGMGYQMFKRERAGTYDLVYLEKHVDPGSH